MVCEKFNEESYSGLLELFQTVSHTKGDETIQLCLRHLVELPEIRADETILQKLDFYLLPTCLHNPTNLSTYIRYLESQDTRQRGHPSILLKLLGYVQCIEVKYIYKVVGNLLGHLGGGRVDGDLYDNVFSARKCFDDIRRRNERIKSYSGQGLIVVSLWSRFLDFGLRNAIGHSDFIIHNESQTVTIPSYVLKNVLRRKGFQAKCSYTFSEIDSFYSMATGFNEAFKKVIQAYGVDLGSRY